jgi:hypothetical protein
MRNGYALCTRDGLDAIAGYLETVEAQELDDLRGALFIGVQWDVEVTGSWGEPRPYVSQAFCSALPVAYSSVPRELWQPFASLVLEAAYEATLRAAVLNAQRGSSNIVLLTSRGQRLVGRARGLHERLVEMTGAQERPSEHDVAEREARVEVERGLQLAESSLMLPGGAEAKPQHHPGPGIGRIVLQGILCMRRGLPEGFLPAPAIVRAAVEGRLPYGLNTLSFSELPILWEEQLHLAS